jgi:hypothetical protein
MEEYIYIFGDVYPTMSFMTKIILAISAVVLLAMFAGIVSAETTFTVDSPEFVQPESGETTFTLSVCEATTEYQVSWSIMDYHEKYEMPVLTNSNVQYDGGNQAFVVKSSSGSCDTFDFSTTSSTTPALYRYRFSPKEGQYFAPYERELRLNVTVLDPEVIRAAEDAEKEAAKVSALEDKIIKQEEKILELQSKVPTTTPTLTPTQEITPTVTTVQETTVQTIGELTGTTIPPTYAPAPTSTANETRIAELEAKVAEQQQKIETQQGWLDKIIAWLWGE